MLLHALPVLLPLPVLLLAAVAALWPWRWRYLLLAFVLGLALSQWQAQRQLDVQWPESRFDEERWVQGSVASLPERSRDRYGGDQTDTQTWRFSFAPKAADGDQLPALIRTSWYRSEAALAGGQCWRLLLRLRAPHGSLNPGGFDYEGWLFRQHLGATATVRDAEPCGVSSGYRVLKLRQAWSTQVDRALGQRPGAALLKALTIGATSDLRDADWDAFRMTGTTHLIAISGFNLALVAGFAFFLLRWGWASWPRASLWLPAQRFALIGSALLASLYALLAGFEPPVARSLFMLLVLALAALTHRLAQTGHALAFAWLAIVVVDPSAVMAPGLWLSFGAVSAIFYIAAGRYRPEPGWRAAIRVQLFLSLVLAPLTLFYFQGLAWAAPFVNLLAVPLFALLTPAALLVMLASVVSSTAAMWLLPPAATTLEYLLQALQWIAAHWPMAWWPDAPPAAALALAVLGCLLLFAPAGLPLRATGLLCLLPLLWPPMQAPRGALEITVLDVGQGLSALVRTRHHSLLFDAGPAYGEGFDAGRSIVVPFALSRGLHRLDVLLLSHSDNDHAGGVPAVRRLLDVRREIGTPQGEACRDGMHWQWDGVRFAILHPDQTGGSDNNGSCVLKIEGPYSMLLPGDIEHQAEARLLELDRPALKSDVLIAPHHGSSTSSTAGFIAAVAPQLVVFPAGWHNRFHHPRPPVVRRYLDCGARLMMTGGQGAITVFRVDGRLHARAWRDEGRRYWNAPSMAHAYWLQEALRLPRGTCGAD
nr:DNA internalization-related competence protein ComEC/Rec2 [Solimonas terrae]